MSVNTFPLEVFDFGVSLSGIMRVVTEYFEHGFYIILRLACPLLVFLKGNEKGNEVFDKP